MERLEIYLPHNLEIEQFYLLLASRQGLEIPTHPETKYIQMDYNEIQELEPPGTLHYNNQEHPYTGLPCQLLIINHVTETLDQDCRYLTTYTSGVVHNTYTGEETHQSKGRLGYSDLNDNVDATTYRYRQQFNQALTELYHRTTPTQTKSKPKHYGQQKLF